MWEPTIKIGSWGFAKGLTRDYLRRIRDAQDEASGPVLADLCRLEDTFGEQIDRLRARDLSGTMRPDGVGQQFPGDLERRARAALENGGTSER